MADIAEDTQPCKSVLKSQILSPSLSNQGSKVGEYLERSAEELMKFAEILYKCSLCTTLPSILTSKSSFLSHVYNQHLNDKVDGHSCAKCGLKFGTPEDLKLHMNSRHPEITVTSVIEANPDEEKATSRSSSPKSDETMDKVEEIKCSTGTFQKSKYCDEDSNIRQSSVNDKMKSSTDIQNESDKKKHNPSLHKPGRVVSTSFGLYNGWGKLPPPPVPGPDAHLHSKNKRTTSESLSQLQRLTDQILVSNASSQKVMPGSFAGMFCHMPPMVQLPGYTQEFGKYTKLVREGGNIVYFCQACNWKCPSKPGFYTHCLGKAHKSKLSMLAKPELTDNPQVEQKTTDKISSSVTCRTKTLNTEDKDSEICKSPSNILLDHLPVRCFSDASGSTSGKDRHQNSPELRNMLSSEHLKSDAPSNKCEENLSVNDDRQKNDKNMVPVHVGDTDTITQMNNCDNILLSPNMKNQDMEKDRISRHRRKRPAPMMVRYQPEDGSGDWSDSGSSVNSEDDKIKPSFPITPERKFMVTSLNKRRILDLCTDTRNDPRNLDPHVRETVTINTRNTDCPTVAMDTKQHPSQMPSETPSSIYSRISQHIAENLTKMVDESSRISPEPPSLSLNCQSNQNVQSPGTLRSQCDIQIKREAENSIHEPGMFKCGLCDFKYHEFKHYRQHYEEEHEGDNSENADGEGSKGCHGESWKILKIKDILPELLSPCSKGNVARDLLLQKVGLVLNTPDIIHWGPACNKAVREEFPSTIAQRKGKFKKTYFFGVAFIEQMNEPEDTTDIDGFSFQPLRDMSLDTDKILRILPELVYWTGDLEYGVSRDELLQLLDEKIDESNVLQWGIECNRAIRRLFPDIHTKRKGKYKTTVFYGVNYLPHVQCVQIHPSPLKHRSMESPGMSTSYSPVRESLSSQGPAAHLPTKPIINQMTSLMENTPVKTVDSSSSDAVVMSNKDANVKS